MTSTRAAVLPAAQAPYEVRDVPMPTPFQDEVVIKAAAWAINPVDYKLQSHNLFPLDYPLIPGSNVAGEVVAVGDAIKKLKIGDRVAAQSQRGDQRREDCGAFAMHVRAAETLTFRLPSHVDYAHGLVFPTGVLTAAAGLYDKDMLALPLPSLQPKPTSKTLLVWGGASAVGSGVIQMACRSGLSVVATASPANFELVKALGAIHVVDYKSDTVEEQLHDILKDADVAGAFDCVGAPTGAPLHCAKILQRLQGSKIIMTVLPMSGEMLDGFEPKMVSAPSVVSKPFIAAVNDFAVRAIEAGALKAIPTPVVVGKGIESLQAAVSEMGKGVSAKKLIVDA